MQAEIQNNNRWIFHTKYSAQKNRHQVFDNYTNSSKGLFHWGVFTESVQTETEVSPPGILHSYARIRLTPRIPLGCILRIPTSRRTIPRDALEERMHPHILPPTHPAPQPPPGVGGQQTPDQIPRLHTRMRGQAQFRVARDAGRMQISQAPAAQPMVDERANAPPIRGGRGGCQRLPDEFGRYVAETLALQAAFGAGRGSAFSMNLMKDSRIYFRLC